MYLSYLSPEDGSLILQAMVGVMVVIAAAVAIAMFAKKKGRNPFGFFVFGLLLWPVALIVLLMADDKSERGSRNSAPSPAPSYAAQPQQAAAPQTQSAHLDELQKVTALRDAGTLSQQEFESEKARIMARSS